MKIRNDFVTNSSSSNYVIAFKNEMNNGDSTFDRLNRISQTLLDHCDYYETESAEYFKSIDSLLGYLHDRFYDDFTLDDLLDNYYCGDNRHKYTVDDLKNYLENGYVIAIKKVSYYDELTKDLIYLFNETNDHFVLLNNFE